MKTMEGGKARAIAAIRLPSKLVEASSCPRVFARTTTDKMMLAVFRTFRLHTLSMPVRVGILQLYARLALLIPGLGFRV